jgi:hypothetical protein
MVGLSHALFQANAGAGLTLRGRRVLEVYADRGFMTHSEDEPFATGNAELASATREIWGHDGRTWFQTTHCWMRCVLEGGGEWVVDLTACQFENAAGTFSARDAAGRPFFCERVARLPLSLGPMLASRYPSGPPRLYVLVRAPPHAPPHRSDRRRRVR